MKRLEKGNFQRPPCAAGADHVEMDATDLAILLAGLELASVNGFGNSASLTVICSFATTSNNCGRGCGSLSPGL